VHDRFQEVYKNAVNPPRQEHLEIAEMYSTLSYVKLLNLCFTRLLKDSLYGHNYSENDDVYLNTKDSRDLSVINYNKVVNFTSELTPDIADDNKSEEYTFATGENMALAKEYEVTVHETAALAKESQITVHEIDMIDEESVVTVFHNDRRT